MFYTFCAYLMFYTLKKINAWIIFLNEINDKKKNKKINDNFPFDADGAHLFLSLLIFWAGKM